MGQGECLGVSTSEEDNPSYEKATEHKRVRRIGRSRVAEGKLLAIYSDKFWQVFCLFQEHG